jgi:ATP-binding cassette subfamily F protein uup
VYGYLEDFLFPPERARSPVKALSGGERGRLLLARLFTRPANVLILDEPTNDLDIETLQVLEARLLEFPGTILLVSHDRRFLNNVVTSTLVFDGDGHIEEYVGGYDDWLRQRDAGGSADRPQPPQPHATAARASASTAGRPRRLSYREERERQEWPARIEALEAERAALETRMADPAFYREEATIIQRAVDRMSALAREIDESYRRWENLESKAHTHGE